MEFGYLERLTIQLTAGAALLPDSLRNLHAEYVVRQQKEDGGWAGREGDSDLYYTAFGLRTLAILGLLTGDVADRASRFLLSKTNCQESIVDLLSLIYGASLIEAATELNPLHSIEADWRKRITDLLHRLRKDDGGFARTEEANVGSTYQTFLVAICLELLGYPLAIDDPAIPFLFNQRKQDGGFLEVRVAKRSGTNPTAAAIGALSTLKGLNSEVSHGAIEFLCSMQSDEGGFQANSRMPIPDLLSTFTGCVTLWDLGAFDLIDSAEADDSTQIDSSIDLPASFRYGLSMARETGGFAGFELDPAEDVEYTFYGVGLLSLLAPWVYEAK